MESLVRIEETRSAKGLQFTWYTYVSRSKVCESRRLGGLHFLHCRLGLLKPSKTLSTPGWVSGWIHQYEGEFPTGRLNFIECTFESAFIECTFQSYLSLRVYLTTVN